MPQPKEASRTARNLTKSREAMWTDLNERINFAFVNDMCCCISKLQEVLISGIYLTARQEEEQQITEDNTKNHGDIERRNGELPQAPWNIWQTKRISMRYY